MIKNLKKKSSGFTLVEVIIVLAIIAIIAAIAIPNLTKVRQDSKLKADIQTAETIKRTIETLIVDETIKYAIADDNKLTIKYDDTNKKAIVDTDAAATKGITASTGNLSDAVDPYLLNVKKPQTDNKTKYEFEIAEDGTVGNVTADNIQ